jgi:hypothetical protein
MGERSVRSAAAGVLAWDEQAVTAPPGTRSCRDRPGRGRGPPAGSAARMTELALTLLSRTAAWEAESDIGWRYLAETLGLCARDAAGAGHEAVPMPRPAG